MREKALTGFLNQVGTQSVNYKDATVSIPQLPETAVNVKITLRATAKFLNEKQWQEVRQLKDRKALQSYVAEKNLHLIDLWDLRHGDGEWVAQIRVKRGQLDQWLRADLPFGMALAGELAELHRILWDQDVHSVNEARKRYGATPGFCGIVISKAGLGARVEACHYAAALRHLGRPVGEVFELRSAPLSTTSDTIQQLLEHVGWEATVQDSYRRVHQGQAVYQLRATSDPPCELVKTCIAQEIVHLQIARLHARRAPPPSEAKQRVEPQTWGDAARCAIGIQKPTMASAEHTCSYDQGTDEVDMDGAFDEDSPAEDDDSEQPADSVKERNWARRLQEPASKLPRTVAGAAPSAPAASANHDRRVDTLVTQMAQVMTLLQSLAGQKDQVL